MKFKIDCYAIWLPMDLKRSEDSHTSLYVVKDVWTDPDVFI